MAKKKYYYSNKKEYYKNKPQQEQDQIFFHSPKFAKIVGQKYGLKGEVIEKSITKYFEALKNLGLTESVNDKPVKKLIDKFNIDYYYDMISGSDVIASCVPSEYLICLRKSSKIGDYSSLFHEFNHLISIRKNNKPVEQGEDVSTGFDELTEENNYCLFNEGITELLACLQYSYLTKQEVAISSYAKETAYANMLYKICGKALFEAYLNGGDFDLIARELNIETEDVKRLAKNISAIYNFSYREIVDIDFIIQSDLISLFSEKIANDVLENIGLYSNFYQIESSVLNTFAQFSKAIYFDSSRESLLNSNRPKVFAQLLNEYYGVIDYIGEYLVENPEFANFKCNYIEPDFSIADSILKVFEIINDGNYALVSFFDKPIDVTKCIDDKSILTMDINLANYKRKKAKIDDVAFMKTYEDYNKIIDAIDNINKFEDKKLAHTIITDFEY